MKVELDDLDRNILSLLMQDASRTNVALARELGVSDSTVRNRIQRLIDLEVMQIVAIIDPWKVGRRLQVHIGIRAEPGQLHTLVDALEKMEAERPDMVVLDWMMPRMDGFALLVHLKKDPKTADIPILMLTAKAQDADIFRGWQSGVDWYLTKPFNPTELIVFVRKLFESKVEGSGDIRYQL